MKEGVPKAGSSGSRRKRGKKEKKYKPNYKLGKDINYEKVEGKEVLRSGTIEAIVEWLLDHIDPPSVLDEEATDEEQERRRKEMEELNSYKLQVFIISYRQFVSPTRFFGILEERWKERDSRQSRYAVIKMLTVWLSKYLNRDFFFHDKGNRLFEQLLEFINYMRNCNESTDANRLKLLILRMRLGDNAVSRIRTMRRTDSNPDAQNRRSFAFCEMPLVELAEQLTLIELHMFRSIREREFLNLNWKKPDKKRHSRHIVKMVDRFNKVSFWVATRIVRETDIRRRTSLLKRFIILAEKCADLRNFNTLMEVLAGLNLCSVQRLKQTWGNLSEKYTETMKTLERMMENKHNYHEYRGRLAEIREAGDSTLPYLGVYLRDLTFVEEGNRTLDENGLINYEKIEMVGQVIREVQYFQSQSTYEELNFTNEVQTIKYLKKLKGLSEDQLDAKSKLCEPPKSVSTV